MNSEMSNPFGGEGPRKTAPPDSGREWKKIAFLILLLLLLIAVMIGIQVGRPKVKPAGKPYQPAGTPRDPENQENAPPSPGLDALEKSAGEALVTMKDGRGKIDKSSDGFLRHLYLFLEIPPEEVSARVDSGITATNLLKKPEESRGKYVRLQGRLVQLYTEPLQVTTTTGTRDVYLGIMKTRPDEKTVTFYLGELPLNAKTGKPMVFETKHHEGQELMTNWIQIEGIFLRIWEYEGNPFPNGEPRWISAPELFVKNIRLIRAPKGQENKQKGFVILIGAVFGGIVIVLLFGGWMAGRYSKGSLRMKLLEVKRKRNPDLFAPKKTSADILGEEVPPSPPPADNEP